jgi:hypothetical protein
MSEGQRFEGHSSRKKVFVKRSCVLKGTVCLREDYFLRENFPLQGTSERSICLKELSVEGVFLSECGSTI